MKIEELVNKIPTVRAAARVIVQEYGHTRKFAKHVVALVIKQLKNLTDIGLIEFLETESIGKMLGYKKKIDPSTFSKVRERSDPDMLKGIYDLILQQKLKGVQLRLIGQDSTDVDAYSSDDQDAKLGVRTVPKKRQKYTKEKVEYFFGYKIHMIADLKREIPISFYIAPADRHEKKTFLGLFEEVKRKFTLALGGKYVADSAFDSYDVREELRYNEVKDVIARNGRGHFNSETPRDRDYGKRWNIEHIFSRLKDTFGMSKNRFIGIKKVMIHVYSCLLAYLISYLK